MYHSRVEKSTEKAKINENFFTPERRFLSALPSPFLSFCPRQQGLEKLLLSFFFDRREEYAKAAARAGKPERNPSPTVLPEKIEGLHGSKRSLYTICRYNDLRLSQYVDSKLRFSIFLKRKLTPWCKYVACAYTLVQKVQNFF